MHHCAYPWKMAQPQSLLGSLVYALVIATASHGLSAAAVQQPVSFRNDVMPVLSKAGCSAGTCHGNKNGKGGFKLSLRGQDPDLDYASLTRDLSARRVNPVAPAE